MSAFSGRLHIVRQEGGRLARGLPTRAKPDNTPRAKRNSRRLRLLKGRVMAETRKSKKDADVLTWKEQIADTLMGPNTPPLEYFGSSEWLDVSTLLVDRSYQHRPYPSAIDALDREFDPAISGFILVNVRRDGSRYVIDGQTRLDVHRIRGYGWILAQVLHGHSPAQEAAIYLHRCVNVQRQPIDFFMAECMAEQPQALMLQALLKQRGIEAERYGSVVLDKSLQTIRCIDTLKKLLWKDEKGERLGAALDLIGDTWGYNKTMLASQPIMVIHSLLMRFDEVIDRKSFVEKLGGYAWADIRSDARRIRESTTRPPSLATMILRQIVDLYNLGRMRRKLELGT